MELTQYIAKLTCCWLGTMYDKTDLVNYQKQIDQIYRSYISEMSAQNLQLRLQLHSISKKIKQIYLSEVKQNISDLQEFYLNTEDITVLKGFIDTFVLHLTATIFHLEDAGIVTSGKLDPYRSSGTEVEADIRKKEDTNPEYLLFLNTRNLMLENTKLIQSFSEFKEQLLEHSQSLCNGVVIHSDTTLQLAANGLQYMLQYAQMLQDLLDSVILAILAYQTYGWNEKADTEDFLYRPFDDIFDDLNTLAKGETP